MSRPKGSKNRRSLLREAEARLEAEEKLRKSRDGMELVDSLFVMEEAMRHFYMRAVLGKASGIPAEKTDADFRDAHAIAKEVAPFRHSRLTAVRLAGDPNNPIRTIREDIPADQLRDEILAEMERLGLFENAGAPQGIENRAVPVTNGSGDGSTD